MACPSYPRCCCLLLLALVAQSFSQRFNTSSVKPYLYTQLEDALVSDGGTLQQLRELFFGMENWPENHSPPTRVSFNPVYVTVDSISPTNCSTACPLCLLAFCNVSKGRALPMARWELRSKGSSLSFSWLLPSARGIKAVDLIKELAEQVITRFGNVLSSVLLLTEIGIYKEPLDEPLDEQLDSVQQYPVRQSLHLSIKSLSCMPDMYELNEALGELLTWIKVYAAVGGKPHTWDSQQQAAVQQATVQQATTLQQYHMNWGPSYSGVNSEPKVVDIIRKSGIVGCFIFSITMAVVIPLLVLGYHNSLVSRATTPGTRSIYWGTAAVCWLLSITIITLSQTTTHYILYVIYEYIFLSSFAFYVVIPMEFLITSLIAARSNRLTTIPIPAAQFTSNVLFCCCCCLYCCSSQRRARGVQAMVLWGFMTFLYFTIMETVALLSFLFITVPLTISFILMYISVLFFVMMLAAYIFFLCHSRKRSHPLVTQIFIGGLNVCAIVLITSLVLLFPITFVFIILYTKPVVGLGAVSLKFSVLPSLGMSVAGWLIRKKLLKEAHHEVEIPRLTTSSSGADTSVNDGTRLEEVEQSPGEQQHLLA